MLSPPTGSTIDLLCETTLHRSAYSAQPNERLLGKSGKQNLMCSGSPQHTSVVHQIYSASRVGRMLGQFTVLSVIDQQSQVYT